VLPKQHILAGCDQAGPLQPVSRRPVDKLQLSAVDGERGSSRRKRRSGAEIMLQKGSIRCSLVIVKRQHLVLAEGTPCGLATAAPSHLARIQLIKVATPQLKTIHIDRIKWLSPLRHFPANFITCRTTHVDWTNTRTFRNKHLMNATAKATSMGAQRLEAYLSSLTAR
jgi:hypothetical protein